MSPTFMLAFVYMAIITVTDINTQISTFFASLDGMCGVVLLSSVSKALHCFITKADRLFDNTNTDSTRATIASPSHDTASPPGVLHGRTGCGSTNNGEDSGGIQDIAEVSYSKSSSAHMNAVVGVTKRYLRRKRERHARLEIVQVPTGGYNYAVM